VLGPVLNPAECRQDSPVLNRVLNRVRSLVHSPQGCHLGNRRHNQVLYPVANQALRRVGNQVLCRVVSRVGNQVLCRVVSRPQCRPYYRQVSPLRGLLVNPQDNLPVSLSLTLPGSPLLPLAHPFLRDSPRACQAASHQCSLHPLPRGNLPRPQRECRRGSPQAGPPSSPLPEGMRATNPPTYHPSSMPTSRRPVPPVVNLQHRLAL
jgi:hypothetical protein